MTADVKDINKVIIALRIPGVTKVIWAKEGK